MFIPIKLSNIEITNVSVCHSSFAFSHLCAEDSQFERVGLDSGQRHGAALQPVGVHGPRQQVATSVQGADVMGGLGIAPDSCRRSDG